MKEVRECILSFLGIALFAGVFEILLPDGNIKKYSSVLIGFVISASFVSLFGLMDDITLEDINTEAFISFENVSIEQDDKIQKEYIANIKKIIEQNGGTATDVEIDDEMRPVKIVFNEPVSESLKNFLTQEMGVSEDVIVVR